jgi:transcriptional regulator with XRE-family HTH domain
MKKLYHNLGQKIKEERIRLGLTQTEFAKLVSSDMNKQKESRWETGQNLPDVFELQKVARICKRPMEYFVAEGKASENFICEKADNHYDAYSEDELRLISKIKTISQDKKTAIETLLGIKKPKK